MLVYLLDLLLVRPMIGMCELLGKACMALFDPKTYR